MEFTGKVTKVLPLMTGKSKSSGKEWRSQNFCVMEEGQYPKTVCFKLFGDKVDSIPQEGDMVRVSFSIDAREYNGRWFNEISAWKVEIIQSAKIQNCGKQTTGRTSSNIENPSIPKQEEPNLPF